MQCINIGNQTHIETIGLIPMHRSSKTINKALKLLEQYDYKFIKVSRKLGIKVTTLRSWFKKKVNNRNLRLSMVNFS